MDPAVVKVLEAEKLIKEARKMLRNRGLIPDPTQENDLSRAVDRAELSAYRLAELISEKEQA